MQIRETERDWEGAIERLLQNLGLSLLVPDEHYAAIANWVDRTHLRGRVVYFRVRESGRAEVHSPHRDSVARKIAIKPDSGFYAWIEREIAHRFDVACCATQEQFRREIRAITRAGQIKGSGERHEKDHRHRLDDRARYVLGRSNAEKIAALEAGYGFELLNHATCMTQREIHYWGDKDTHGFAILDELRHRFAHVCSLLMDQNTFSAFAHLWGREPAATSRDLPLLTPDENQLYNDLRDNRFGQNLRLEQEKIGFTWLQTALARLQNSQ